MRRICFVGMDDYVLNPITYRRYTGGESVQQSLLARAFAELGYEVSVILQDCGQPERMKVDNINIIRSYRRGTGIRGLRYIHPRITRTLKVLNDIDADVYYQSPAGLMTGISAAFCRLKNRIFVHRIASDANCVPGQQLIRSVRDRKVYEYGLKRADVIAAQSRHQVGLLENHYGLPSNLVNMTVETPSGKSQFRKEIDVLWVNHLRHCKRPELMLSLAKRLPQCRFVMIGGPCPGRETYFEIIREQALAFPNLEFLGAMPYGEVNNYFAKSRLLVNTSDIEGFPNSFLQAWARELPVVSFFDPDNIIVNRGFGRIAEDGDIEQMATQIESLLDDEAERRQKGENARRYVEENYSESSVAKKYIELIEQISQVRGK